jgi:predicted NBD/HSP70 family sugar kinase
MGHLAIDLGGKESQIWVRSSDGRIVEERRCRTAMLPAYLATRPRSRVVVETCSEAFGIADAALGLGHHVRVVLSGSAGRALSAPIDHASPRRAS